jgi:hypothetical protein
MWGRRGRVHAVWCYPVEQLAELFVTFGDGAGAEIGEGEAAPVVGEGVGVPAAALAGGAGSEERVGIGLAGGARLSGAVAFGAGALWAEKGEEGGVGFRERAAAAGAFAAGREFEEVPGPAVDFELAAVRGGLIDQAPGSALASGHGEFEAVGETVEGCGAGGDAVDDDAEGCVGGDEAGDEVGGGVAEVDGAALGEEALEARFAEEGEGGGEGVGGGGVGLGAAGFADGPLTPALSPARRVGERVGSR